MEVRLGSCSSMTTLMVQASTLLWLSGCFSGFMAIMLCFGGMSSKWSSHQALPPIAPIPKPYSAFCKDIYESDDEDNFRLDGEGKKNKKRDILLRMDRRSETRSPGNLGLVIDLENGILFPPVLCLALTIFHGTGGGNIQPPTSNQSIRLCPRNIVYLYSWKTLRRTYLTVVGRLMVAANWSLQRLCLLRGLCRPGAVFKDFFGCKLAPKDRSILSCGPFSPHVQCNFVGAADIDFKSDQFRHGVILSKRLHDGLKSKMRSHISVGRDEMKRLGKLCPSLRPSVLSPTGTPAATKEMNLDEGGDDATSPLITTPLSSKVVVLSLVFLLLPSPVQIKRWMMMFLCCTTTNANMLIPMLRPKLLLIPFFDHAPATVIVDEVPDSIISPKLPATIPVVPAAAPETLTISGAIIFLG
ncbi:hypothetical protein Acr_22g0006730 [Actinidia rufa]|uniref:Uncharacterized protein n=1 Tax=Actinidia rufa TaxID=165716 RepID=A0A7J0GKG5_9ERIC|nr:hypothetical protein Acr_22g0006730 [Actinidia rufa]